MFITNFFDILLQKGHKPILRANHCRSPSVVTDTSFLNLNCIFDAHSRKPSKMSFPIVLPLSGTNLTSSSIVINSEFIRRRNIAYYAISLTSTLKFSATE